MRHFCRQLQLTQEFQYLKLCSRVRGLFVLWVIRQNTKLMLIRVLPKRRYQMELLLLDLFNGPALTVSITTVNGHRSTLVMATNTNKTRLSTQLIHHLSKVIHLSMKVVKSLHRTRQLWLQRLLSQMERKRRKKRSNEVEQEFKLRI